MRLLWFPIRLKVHILTATPASCAPVVATPLLSLLEPEQPGTRESPVLMDVTAFTSCFWMSECSCCEVKLVGSVNLTFHFQGFSFNLGVLCTSAHLHPRAVQLKGGTAQNVLLGRVTRRHHLGSTRGGEGINSFFSSKQERQSEGDKA